MVPIDTNEEELKACDERKLLKSTFLTDLNLINEKWNKAIMEAKHG